MFKRLLGVVALSCACGTAVAGYGFEPPESLANSELGALSIAVADMSGDARDDLVVLAKGNHPDWNHQVVVYAQTGDGNLVPAAAYPYGAEFGSKLKLADLDSDGDQDIVVSHSSGWRVLQNQGDLQFLLSTYPATGVGPSDFDFMDVDGDGRLDIVAMSEWEGSAVYFGDGNCGFLGRIALDIPGGPGMHLVDMNRDGRRDIAYPRIGGEGIFVHLHQNGGFSSDYRVVRLGYTPWRGDHTLISDIDGDGLPDIAFSRSWGYSTRIVMYGQRHDGSYRKKRVLNSSLVYGGPLVASDIDGDGRHDILQTGESSGAVGVHFNKGIGFGSEAKFPVGGIGNTLQGAIGDLNGDGLQDIALTGSYGAVSYLLGRGTPTQADLGVYLGLSRTSVAVRVENHSEFTASDGYEITLTLDARFGSVSTDSVPDGCHDPGWSEDGVYLMCGFEGLPPGSSRTLMIPITLPPRATSNRLIAHAQLLTFGTDLRASNDVARKWIAISPVRGKTGKRRLSQ